MNYKDGRTLKKYYCKDCDKELSSYQATRCSICAQKSENNSMFGKRLIGKLNGMHDKKHTKQSRRKMSLTRGGTGIPYENNNYSQEFDNKLKLKIRERDNYTCQNCEMIEEEHIIVYGQVLEVHHIDYNKKDCKEENLLSLCKQCNLRANKNRKHWTKYFRSIIKCYSKR